MGLPFSDNKLAYFNNSFVMDYLPRILVISQKGLPWQP